MKVPKEDTISNESFAEFIGLSAPEVPKYLVLNNFLSNYFKVEVFERQEIIDFKKNPRIFTQENEGLGKEILEKSFAAYIDSYTGYLEYTNRKRDGNKPWFYPIIPSMLTTTDRATLRHLLYMLQKVGAQDYSDYKEMQDSLYQYLYRGNNEIHELFQFICGPIDDIEKIRISSPPDREFGAQSERPFFKTLSKQFIALMNKILHNKYLLETDFFTRIEFLSNFLTLYVMEYLLERTNDGKTFKTKNIFLCKGSVDPNLHSGPFHKACIGNYSNIRARFSELLKVQFNEIVNQIDTGSFHLYEKEDELYISYNHEENKLIDFLTNHKLSSVRRDKTKQDLINKYKELMKKQFDFSKDEFALQCFNIQKKSSGLTISKVSSILPTMGREVNFVHPRNRAKQKYFALSEELAIFLVRLYLIHVDKDYAHYDDFVNWLNHDCNIYFSLDIKGVLKKYLNTFSADIPMFDMNRNEKEFVKTLTNVNCLIRLSDSGYLVVLPDKKGGVNFL